MLNVYRALHYFPFLKTFGEAPFPKMLEAKSCQASGATVQQVKLSS